MLLYTKYVRLTHCTLMTVRFGSDEDCNFSIAGNVTLHPCRAREVRLWRGLRCWRPEFVILELEMFKETRLVMPAQRNSLILTPPSLIISTHPPSPDQCTYVHAALSRSKTRQGKEIGEMMTIMLYRCHPQKAR